MNETTMAMTATTHASTKLPMDPSGAIKISAERRPGHAPATYSFRTKMPAGSPAQRAPIAVPTSRC